MSSLKVDELFNDKMYKRTLREKAKFLKGLMMGHRREVKGSLADIEILIKANYSGDYSKVYQTKLYEQHGGEYCEYLELINLNRAVIIN